MGHVPDHHDPCHDPCPMARAWRVKPRPDSSGLGPEAARTYLQNFTEGAIWIIDHRARQRAQGAAPSEALPRRLGEAARLAAMERPDEDDLRAAVFQRHVRMASTVFMFEWLARSQYASAHGLSVTVQWAKPEGKAPDVWQQKRKPIGRLANTLTMSVSGSLRDRHGRRHPWHVVLLEAPVRPPSRHGRMALEASICDAFETVLEDLACAATVLRKNDPKAARLLGQLTTLVEPLPFGPPTRKREKADPEHCFMPATSARFVSLLEKHERPWLLRFTAPSEQLARGQGVGNLSVHRQGVHSNLGTSELRQMIEELAIHADGTRTHRQIVETLDLTVKTKEKSRLRISLSARDVFVVGPRGEHVPCHIALVHLDDGRTAGWIASAPAGISIDWVLVTLFAPYSRRWRGTRRVCLRRWREDVAIRFRMHGSSKHTSEVQAMANLANCVFLVLSLENQPSPQRA